MHACVSHVSRICIICCVLPLLLYRTFLIIIISYFSLCSIVCYINLCECDFNFFVDRKQIVCFCKNTITDRSASVGSVGRVFSIKNVLKAFGIKWEDKWYQSANGA